MRTVFRVLMLLCAAATLAAFHAHAQTGGRGMLGYGYGLGGEATGLSFSGIDPSGVRSPGPGEGGTLQSQEWRAFALVPVYGRGTDTVWSAGLSAEQLSLHFAGFAPALSPVLISELYGVALDGSVMHRVDGDHSWLAYVAAGRFSDQWPPDGQGRTAAGGIYQWRASPTTILGAGAGFTYVFGEPRAVPILALAFREGPWSADVRFPFRADVRYAINEWVRVGAETFVQGGEFNVTKETAVDTVQYTSQLAAALLTIGRPGRLQFQLDTGIAVYRHYTALDNGNTVESLGFKDAPFYRAGLAWRW